MLNYRRGFLLILVIASLTGCKGNFIKEHQTEYLRSRSSPPLQVPPGMNRADINTDYVVPPLVNQQGQQPVSLAPPASSAEKVTSGEVPVKALEEKPQQKTKVNTADNPTLSLTQTTAQTWSAIGDGLKDASYGIVNENKKSGVYYLVDIPATGGRLKRDTPIYQLHLRDTDSGAVASITDNEGKLIDPTIAQRILTDLNKALAGKAPSSFSRWVKNLF